MNEYCNEELFKINVDLFLTIFLLVLFYIILCFKIYQIEDQEEEIPPSYSFVIINSLV